MPILSGSSSRLFGEKKHKHPKIGTVQPPPGVFTGVFENPCFFLFFPKKSHGGYLFHMFPLLGIFCSFSRGSGERLWWHLCDAAPCGGDGGVTERCERMRSRKTPATTSVWGLGWAWQPKKRRRLSEKQGDFYFEHDVTLSLIYCLCIFEHTYRTEAARCHVPCAM